MAFLFEEKLQPPINLSPYTEWRASMMGLAGRDPIFHAQLESEKTMRPSQAGFLDNTCYRCHGVMGQRQIESDKQQPFEHSMVYALPDERPVDLYVGEQMDVYLKAASIPKGISLEAGPGASLPFDDVHEPSSIDQPSKQAKTSP